MKRRKKHTNLGIYDIGMFTQNEINSCRRIVAASNICTKLIFGVNKFFTNLNSNHVCRCYMLYWNSRQKSCIMRFCVKFVCRRNKNSKKLNGIQFLCCTIQFGLALINESGLARIIDDSNTFISARFVRAISIIAILPNRTIQLFRISRHFDAFAEICCK